MKVAKIKLPLGPAPLLWAGALFLGIQIVLNVALNHWGLGSCDPEFAVKLAHLRATQAREQDRPLVVFLGSSRTFFGLRPDRLPDHLTAGGRPPLFFNFGISGFGPPLYELVCLRRLLAAGIHPDWLFIEVLPGSLMAEGPGESDNVLISRATIGDFSTLSRYCPRPLPVVWQWTKNRLVPAFSFRFSFLESIAPSWIPPAVQLSRVTYDQDDRGWLLRADTFTPAEKLARFNQARESFRPALSNLRISLTSDRALREILDLCRSRGIRAALYLMPEGKVFQSWYSPASRQVIDAYLAQLAAQYQVPLLDARDWVAEDDFYDSHHLTIHGASVFTRRLGQNMKPVVAARARS